MNLSKIKFSDIEKVLKEIEDGSVKSFLNEIVSRKKEIEYIQKSMILSIYYISDTLKLKNGEYTKEIEVIIDRDTSPEALTEKLKEMLLDFVLTTERPKNINPTDWYNYQKKYYSAIDIDHILENFTPENNYNCYKLMTRENPFGLSIRLSPMRENINLSIEF